MFFEITYKFGKLKFIIYIRYMNEKRRGRELGRKPGKEKTQCHREERRCDLEKLCFSCLQTNTRKKYCSRILPLPGVKAWDLLIFQKTILLNCLINSSILCPLKFRWEVLKHSWVSRFNSNFSVQYRFLVSPPKASSDSGKLPWDSWVYITVGFRGRSQLGWELQIWVTR